MPAPAGLDAGTASQLIRGVRWTRWSAVRQNGLMALPGLWPTQPCGCSSPNSYQLHRSLDRRARPHQVPGGKGVSARWPGHE
jgi:hypothetical protein